MVGCWCTISVVCVLIHPAYDLVIQYMNFCFACVGSSDSSNIACKKEMEPYCPNCRMDSHTEEKCGKVTFCKLPNKRKFGRLDSKPGKGELVAKKTKNFASFKAEGRRQRAFVEVL